MDVKYQCCFNITIVLAVLKLWWSVATARRCYASQVVAALGSLRDAPSGGRETETARLQMLHHHISFLFSHGNPHLLPFLALNKAFFLFTLLEFLPF